MHRGKKRVMMSIRSIAAALAIGTACTAAYATAAPVKTTPLVAQMPTPTPSPSTTPTLMPPVTPVP